MKKIVLLAIITAFCFIGCETDGGGNGNGNENKDPGKKLVITGIPSEAGIIGAALLDDNINPVVAGMNIGGNFILIEFGPEGPDFTKVWKGTGQYYIALSNKADMDDPEAERYIYTAGDALELSFDVPGFFTAMMADPLTDPDPQLFLSFSWKKYNFNQETSTIPWGHFKKIPNIDEITAFIYGKIAEAMQQ